MLTKQRELSFLREHFSVNLTTKVKGYVYTIPSLPLLPFCCLDCGCNAGAQAARLNHETARIKPQDRRSLDSFNGAAALSDLECLPSIFFYMMEKYKLLSYLCYCLPQTLHRCSQLCIVITPRGKYCYTSFIDEEAKTYRG